MHYWDKLLLVFLLSFTLRNIACGATTNAPDTSEEVHVEMCKLVDYRAKCKIRILQELIEVSVTVNQCHVPLDITFKIVYKYGEGSSHHWQYTFVTTNQNERVLVPGLSLPITPHALIYLYVRVPQPLFQLHNSSLAAVEASLVGVLSQDESEEVEFINDTVVVGKAEVCPNGQLSLRHSSQQRTFFIVGGSLMGLLLVFCLVVLLLWVYRKRKLAREHLNLVNSLEPGLPGAEPYQLGAQTSNGITSSQNHRAQAKNPTSESTSKDESSEITNESKPKAKGLISGFKFGRLKEEGTDDAKQKVVRKLDKAFVIGNPVLVDKTAMFEERPEALPHTKNNNNASGTIMNQNAVDEDDNEMRGHQNGGNSDGGVDEQLKWRKHPLEASSENSEGFGARPKTKLDVQLEMRNCGQETKD